MHTTPLSAQILDALRKYPEKSRAELAAMFGCTRQNVSSTARRYGLSKPRHTSARVTEDGVSVLALAKQHGISAAMVGQRIRNGWPADKAATTPPGDRGRPPLRLPDGRRAVDVARENGVTAHVMHQRLRSGWDLTRAITTPTAPRTPAGTAELPPPEEDGIT